MSVRTEPWPAGAPAWLSLTAPDIGAATAFYGDLLGWEFLEGATPDGRTYLTALLHGRPVAGVGQPTAPDTPAQWTVFLASDDAAAAVDAARTAGAVLADPMRVGDAGTAALLSDPAGAAVGVWQADEHLGTGVVDDPGAPIWCELVTPDLDAAKGFYADVFGVTYEAVAELSTPYVSVRTREGVAAGMGEPDPEIGWDGTPHWLVYFAVTDPDTAVVVAENHGGRAERAPFDSPFGRIAVLRGPSGERFALLAPAETPPDEPPTQE